MNNVCLKPFVFTFILFTCLSCNFNKNKKSKVSQNSHTSANIDSEIMSYGKQIYTMKCVTCHMPNGQGVPKAFPPLARSDYLMADKNQAIHQVINGSEGKMVVNGKTYNNIMPPQELNDEDIAAVLTYVMNSWGNNGGPVTVIEVNKVRNTK